MSRAPHTGPERPEWMDRVVKRVADDPPEYFTTFRPPPDPPRRSAVLNRAPRNGG